MKQKIGGRLVITSYKYEKFHKESVTKQVACFIVDNQLEYFKVIPKDTSFAAGTIVTGKVTNVVNNIPAAFVMLDDQKTMGFLPIEKVKNPVVVNRAYQGKFKSGDEVLVQVVRESIKTKEATLTTNIQIHGLYCMVSAGTGRIVFSKKLSQSTKEKLMDALVKKAIITRDKKLIGMEDIDITIRTKAGKLLEQKKLEYLGEDVERTYQSYLDLIRQARTRTCYTIHQKPVSWIQEVWQELNTCGFDIEEYITDDLEMLKSLEEIVDEKELGKLRFYQDPKLSLSVLYGIHSKVTELQNKQAWLPSGGYLVIEPTEALTVIDVNSGKAVGSGDNQKLYFDTNLEAAKESLRQLRLRNISGMIVIDFINMKDKAMEEQLLLSMKEWARQDYSKITLYEFTKLGLMELTRNKKSKALHEVM